VPYRTISYKDAHYRFFASRPDLVTAEIVRLREALESYISRHPLFASSLEPVPVLPDAPPVARAMHAAAQLTGVGPMAAVAGAIAEAAVRAALRPAPGAGIPSPDPADPDPAARDGVVVENGGDIFLWTPRETVVGLFAGKSSVSGRIGFAVPAGRMPLAVCSSSGTMGHSLSFGRADLATAVASDGALADAAATLAGNLVRNAEDIPDALDRVCRIPGVHGVLIVVGEKVGLEGDLPPLVRIRDEGFVAKITRDERSGFRF